MRKCVDNLLDFPGTFLSIGARGVIVTEAPVWEVSDTISVELELLLRVLGMERRHQHPCWRPEKNF